VPVQGVASGSRRLFGGAALEIAPFIPPDPLLGIIRTATRAAPVVVTRDRAWPALRARVTAAPISISQDRARAAIVSTDAAAPALVTHHTVRLRRG
jgi:hypothetical protein